MNKILEELKKYINFQLWEQLHDLESIVVVADRDVADKVEEIVLYINKKSKVQKCSLDKVQNIDFTLYDCVLIIEKEFVDAALQLVDCENVFFYAPKTFDSVYRFFELYKEQGKIEELFKMLADDISATIVMNILKARITDNMAYIDKIQDKNKGNEYVDKSIISFSDDECFLDAGAYTGDSFLRFLRQTNYRFNAAYLFEPDPQNYDILQKQINKKIMVGDTEGKICYKKLSDDSVNKIHIYNKGLYSHTAELEFSSNIGEASHISGNIPMKVEEKNERVIQVIGIDEWIGDKKLSVIKMDIEGSEMDALNGAQNTIKKYIPNLIICIYHKKTDLWEIPLYIKTLANEYRFCIRHYNSNLWDTVLYAIKGGNKDE